MRLSRAHTATRSSFWRHGSRRILLEPKFNARWDSDARPTLLKPDRFTTWLRDMLRPALTRAEQDLASARATMDAAGRRDLGAHPPVFITALVTLRNAADRQYDPHGRASDSWTIQRGAAGEATAAGGSGSRSPARTTTGDDTPSRRLPTHPSITEADDDDFVSRVLEGSRESDDDGDLSKSPTRGGDAAAGSETGDRTRTLPTDFEGLLTTAFDIIDDMELPALVPRTAESTMYALQIAYEAGCAGQGFAQRDLRWNTLRADDPTPPWYYRVYMLIRAVEAHPPHPLFTALARLNTILRNARPPPKRAQRPPRRRHEKPVRGTHDGSSRLRSRPHRQGYSVNAHKAAPDVNVRPASADSVLTTTERDWSAWTAPELQYGAAALPLTQGVVDIMQDGYNIQDTSLLYYAGPDI